MNYLINIAGPSGVGKTTIANLILSMQEYNSCIIVSGDDSHKWERGSKNWQKFTHLNPEANNIKDEFKQLFLLKNDKIIKRKNYNHATGKFDPEKEITPKKIIIYEGLHALYEKQVRDISNLKIYVDTDEELKIAWKLKRDLNKRGYTEQQILETIKKRMDDEKKFIIPQKNFADAVVKFTLDETNGVMFHYEILNNSFYNFFEKLKSFYNLKKDFINICKLISENDDLIQNKGGNISVKFEDKTIITSSGYDIKNVSMFEGNCILETKSPKNIIYNYGRPSMEVKSHLALDEATIHTHPIYLLAILCSKESKNILKKIYKNYKFDYIEYVTPGDDLYEKIKTYKNNIIFCENHGLFVTSKNLYQSLKITNEINEIAKKFIVKNNIKDLETSDHLFPDSVVLNTNKQLNNTIFSYIISSKLEPKFLNKQQIENILNLEAEKYRSKQ
jgi:uridine kinase/ribulose-5-phosphate 4-epimerase/fuculose-1-phosphate aldolase